MANPLPVTQHRRNGLCRSPRCQPCAERRQVLTEILAVTPLTITKLPAHVSSFPANFIGEDGLPRYATPAQRREVYDRDRGICQYCKRRVSFQACNIDHLIPWPKGQTLNHNLVTACRGCNRAKGRYNAHG